MSVSEILNSDGVLWVMVGAVAVVAILAGTITSAIKVRSRERSRREIAAYIAEGSMTPEQGERLMRADSSAEEIA